MGAIEQIQELQLFERATARSAAKQRGYSKHTLRHKERIS